MVIILFAPESRARRLKHAAFLAAASGLPLALWLARNYALTSTLFGPRAPSSYTLAQNISFVVDTIASWFVPARVAQHRRILASAFAVFVVLAVASRKHNPRSVPTAVRRVGPTLAFILLYMAFLVASSTTTAYDSIGDRLLSPIYVPLALLLAVLADDVVWAGRRHLGPKLAGILFAAVCSLAAIYPAAFLARFALEHRNEGHGYSGREWRQSEIAAYLRRNAHVLATRYDLLYSNAPDALYLLADLPSRKTPAKTHYNSPKPAENLQNLRGTWPERQPAGLVWFEKIEQNYLFSPEELGSIAELDRVDKLTDGAVYSVKRK